MRFVGVGLSRRVVNVVVGVLFAVLAVSSAVEGQFGVAAVQGVFCVVNLLAGGYVPHYGCDVSRCTSHCPAVNSVGDRWRWSRTKRL